MQWMHTMKLTRSALKDIRAKAISLVPGATRVEVARRQAEGNPDHTTFNSLLWEEEADLDDLFKLHEIAGKEIEATPQGTAVLDLYVYGLDHGTYSLLDNLDLTVWEDGARWNVHDPFGGR
jgi:hypothetical protein